MRIKRLTQAERLALAIEAQEKDGGSVDWRSMPAFAATKDHVIGFGFTQAEAVTDLGAAIEYVREEGNNG